MITNAVYELSRVPSDQRLLKLIAYEMESKSVLVVEDAGLGVPKHISDKIAYVFETRQAQLEMLTKELARRFELGMNDASYVVIGLDAQTRQLNPVTQ